MNKLYILALAAASAVMPAGAQSKFDAGGHIVVSQYLTMQNYAPEAVLPLCDLPVDLESASRAGGKVSVFVGLNPGASAADLEAMGFEITLDCGETVLAYGPMDAIIALDNCDWVRSLSFGEKREAHLDLARTGTGVESIHNGTGLNSSYRGAGVIAGIYDTGFDAQHANFRNTDGSTRLGTLFHFAGSNGTCKTYEGADILKFTTDNTAEDHGTHTAGCMAGSFNQRGGGSVAMMSSSNRIQCGARFSNPYYGMAPEATLAVGCGALYDPNIMAAVGKIAEYAKAQGKPAVINLSIGASLGPHDGTDEVSRMLDEIGKDVIICISAGNEGDIPMSVTKKFTSSELSVSTFFTSGRSTTSGVFDIYSNDATQFTVTPFIYSKSANQIIYSRDFAPKEGEQVLSTTDYTIAGYVHATEFDRAFGKQSYVLMSGSLNAGTNNRYSTRVQVNINNNAVTNPTGDYVLGFKITGSNGQLIHMTTNSSTAEFTDLGLSGFADGSASFSISSMACAHNVIAVGAWNTRFRIPVLGQNNTGAIYTYYENTGMGQDSIAGYSSWGVLADGRELPHVCAPGSGIISSISKYYYDRAVQSAPAYAQQISANQTFNDRTNQWESMQGTSMASPIVAGAIALWLQVDPTLTVDKARELAISTATRDQYVTGAPYPVQWGAGKFNALAGIQKLLGQGVYNVSADTADGMFIAPAGENVWTVTVPAATNLNIAIYNTQGQLVASVTGEGSTATVSTESLAPGVYILTANGTESTRLAVR